MSSPPDAVRRRSARWSTPDRKGPGIAVAAVVIPILTRLFIRRRWRGQAAIPVRGGAILALNHISVTDPLMIAEYVFDSGRVPRFMVKAELFGVPLAGRLLRSCDQIPVHRGAPTAASVLRDAVQALEQGQVVVIYPEGTTTKDPDLWPMLARTGIARLALSTGAPVIPIAQWGAQQVYSPQLGLHPFARPLQQITSGPPVDLTAWQGRALSADVLREVTDAIMADVAGLLAGLRGDRVPARPYVPPQVP